MVASEPSRPAMEEEPSGLIRSTGKRLVAGAARTIATVAHWRSSSAHASLRHDARNHRNGARSTGEESQGQDHGVDDEATDQQDGDRGEHGLSFRYRFGLFTASASRHRER